jgi:hypothetical protein
VPELVVLALALVPLSERAYNCDVKELSSSQNSERSKFKSKNIIKRRLIY